MIQQKIEYLQFLLTDDTISLSEGNEKIYMLKEKAVLERHTKKIFQRSDGRYITKVVVGSKILQKNGKTYEELISKLYDFYYGLENTTLEKLYPLWLEYRINESSVKEKTIKENKFIWNAHLDGQQITKRPLNNLLPLDFIIFFRSITKNRTMTRKRFNDMKSVLNGIIYYAIENGITNQNPLNNINYRQFSFKAEKSNVVPYTEAERKMLLDYIPNNDLYSLAIKLDFYLVLRIGELKALRFDDIDNGIIFIQRIMNDKNEIENDIKGHASEGYRQIPLTKDCLKVIETIRLINPDSEYMFIKDNKPLVTCTFNRRLKKYCDELNIKYRSSHKIRFTQASILYKNGVNATEIQKLLGHTTLDMTTHYLKNIRELDETASKMSEIFG